MLKTLQDSALRKKGANATPTQGTYPQETNHKISVNTRR